MPIQLLDGMRVETPQGFDAKYNKKEKIITIGYGATEHEFELEDYIALAKSDGMWKIFEQMVRDDEERQWDGTPGKRTIVMRIDKAGIAWDF